MSNRARVLALIPAYNEAASLPTVVDTLRRRCPDFDLLVINDGSTDETAALLPGLRVRWLEWPERRGLGCALRVGLRYAARLGYGAVVRLDADGQHDVEDAARLLAPLELGVADVVVGSRFYSGHGSRRQPPIQRALGTVLSAITRRPVTDPTSGFWALGPRAVAMLAEDHPGGYPEPELHLLLSHNGLRVVEVDVKWQARLHGRTSLTSTRLMAASARVALAMLIVPLRASARSSHD
jgi:glycosyltransferase involved in cell wall biosynthesis